MAKPPPRLFVRDAGLSAGRNLPVDGPAWHYLHNVLRLGAGDALILFDGLTGEWSAVIGAAERRRGMIEVGQRRRTQPMAASAPVLFFAPLKKDPTELIVQKATELGVARLQPVLTERTSLPKQGLRTDRLETIAIEAAEQCERLNIPVIAEPLPLREALEGLAQTETLLFADEAGDDPAARWGGDIGRGRTALSALADTDTPPIVILTGPEGGFTPEEREALRARPGTLAVSLGPRILKAETAAISALVLWQAVCGDWR